MKKAIKHLPFIFVLLVFTSVTKIPAQTCTPAPVGLVAWWSGDGNALDARSRNNGTLNNGATFVVGRVQQTFRLDGVDDFVSIPGSSSLDVGTSANGFSIESWLIPLTTESRPLVEWFTNSTTIGVHIWVNCSGSGCANNPGALFANIVDTAQQSHIISTPISVLNPTNWSHIGLTYDKTTGMARLYRDAIEVQAANLGIFTPQTNNNSVFFGNRTNRFFPANIDEMSVYNRPLSVTELQAIYNSSGFGKCKPTATAGPAGLVGFWAGDGNANDISGTNNGTLQNGTGFALGKVGQGFSFDGIDDTIEIPDSPSINPTTQISFEGWVLPTATSGAPDYVASILNKEANISAPQYEAGRRNTTVCLSGGGIPEGNFAFFLGGLSGLPDDCSGWVNGNGNLPLNNWSHIALTYDGANVRAFVNGIQTRQIAATGSLPVTAGTMHIGGRSDPSSSSKWRGLLDEVSIYNRALTQAEIMSIVNAGFAGKLKENNTPTGSNVVVTTNGDATVTFPGVTTAGRTQQIPMALSQLPALALFPTGLTYDISTSAVFSGSPQVCFNLPAIRNPIDFGNLRIMHLESNVWQNRTDLASINFATKTICSSGLTSLSPFAIATVAPLAAAVSISGRVTTANGQGIRNARLILTATDGSRRTATTSTFGYYKFDEVEIGHTYVLEVVSRRYTFANPTRVFTLQDELTDMDFVAESK